MLSPEEFREKYDDEELAAELPDSPISSLRSIQYLYGKLYTLGTLGGGPYAPYLTPDAASDLIDTEDSLIVVRVDISGDEPSLANDDRGAVWVTRYSKELIESVAHCYFQNRGAGIDHSITHKTGQDKSPERIGEYAKHRFTRWPTEDGVQSLANHHEEGWVIEKLKEIGETGDLVQQVKEEVQRQISDDQTALITVQVKLNADGEYLWPNEVDVLMEGMRAQRLSKLVTKNKATNSSGESLDIITGEETRTVGTAQDPLNYFLGKQREKFQGLDIEEAWRSHPISEDGAITIMNAKNFVDSCSYDTFGARVYYLPYFRDRPTPENARVLYTLLYRVAVDDEMTTIEETFRELREKNIPEYKLRFYVSAVNPKQASRYDVFGETMNGRLLYPKTLAVEHNNVVDKTAAFQSDSQRTAPMPTHDGWNLLTEDNQRLHSVSTGWYFGETFAERDDDDEAAADDPRIEALIAVLSGDSISVETLLEEYVDRIGTDENDENVESFPSFRVASQFAQLCALATDELDLLSTEDPGKESITREPNYEEHSMTSVEDILRADGGNAAAEKLETFIEKTPALAHGPDVSLNDQRRGAFLLGVLIGEVGGYQNYSEERSTTLIDQYPVKSITRTRIKKVTQEAIGKTITYTRKEDRTITLFEHVVERLRETILRPDPEEWEIGTDDLRFYYALGVTYGMNDHPDWEQTETDIEEDH